MLPVTPVMYQPPLAPVPGAMMVLLRRHSISMPIISAARNSSPVTGCVSATASSAEITGPVGCVMVARCVSSKACAAEREAIDHRGARRIETLAPPDHAARPARNSSARP